MIFTKHRADCPCPACSDPATVPRQTDSEVLRSIRGWLRAIAIVWLALVAAGGVVAWNSYQHDQCLEQAVFSFEC